MDDKIIKIIDEINRSMDDYYEKKEDSKAEVLNELYEWIIQEVID